MRDVFKILIVTAAVAVMSGCNRINPFGNDEALIARVGESKLYVSDVESLFTPGISADDSLKLLESYVDLWVKKQLKIQEAEKMFRSNSGDIDRMVQEYRNSLLSHKLDQYYVDNNIDTLFSDQAVADYYDSHRNDFILDRTILKGVVVKLPASFRQGVLMKQLMESTGERYQDFIDISRKNDFPLSEFESWTDLGDFLAVLPLSVQDNYEELLTRQGVSEIKDGDDLYYVKVSELLRAGDPTPLERVGDVIRRVLFNQRKQEIIRMYEDSIYREAAATDKIEINL